MRTQETTIVVLTPEERSRLTAASRLCRDIARQLEGKKGTDYHCRPRAEFAADALDKLLVDCPLENKAP